MGNRWSRIRLGMVIGSMLSLLAVAPVAMGANQTVAQLADGVVRPSPLLGAHEAYLPIIRPSNHASNLLQLPNGDLFLFWFSGTEEGHGDVSIAMSRLKHGANAWSLPVIVASNPGRSDQNPVPFFSPDGVLHLYYTAQERLNENTTLIYETLSKDQGQTWSEPRQLFTKPGWYDRQHIVIFHDEWLFPFYFMNSGGITHGAEGNVSAVKLSKDQGQTWSTCDVPNSGGLVQMNIVTLSDHNLIAFFRSRFADWIYESQSSDGCHWSDPVKTVLPNNNSSIQVTRLKDGHLVIVFNNSQARTTRTKTGSAPRGVLSVALSDNDGKTWSWVRDLQAGATPPAYGPGEDFEYSYPSVIQSADGSIQVSFSFRRETIKYMTFVEDWIKDGHTVGLFHGSNKEVSGPNLINCCK
ncbi:MAG: sialidase family protein [Acidobacteriaceae bacterium]